MKFDEIIGRRIKDRRMALGISQADLAKKLGYSGKSMISLIETGKRSLNASQIAPLAKALSCDIDDLLDGTDPTHDEIIDLLDRLSPEQLEAALKFLQAMIGDK